MLRKLTPLIAIGLLSACAESPTTPGIAMLDASIATADVPAQAKQGESRGETIYGLTEGNQLLTFAAGKSNQTSSSVTITGLAAGEEVVAIDFRPSDTGTNGVSDIGKLYALTDANRLYIIDTATGAATSPVTLSTALVGTSFGIGFNPTVDRLRIHSDANQNLRVNVETGATTVDGALAFTAGDVNFGKNPDVTATGYTNNDAVTSTGTELYAIDVAQDILVEFGPASALGVVPATGPNSGQLLTVGTLGVDAGLLAGFDISNATGIAYAALSTSPSGKSTLYTVDLNTGAATRLGLFAQTKSPLLSIAVQP